MPAACPEIMKPWDLIKLAPNAGEPWEIPHGESSQAE